MKKWFIYTLLSLFVMHSAPLVSIGQAQSVRTYTATVLPLPKGVISLVPTAVNSLGQSVGYARFKLGSDQPFLSLPSPAFGKPAGTYLLSVPSGFDRCLASSINDRGDVVGYCEPYYMWTYPTNYTNGIRSLLWLNTSFNGRQVGRYDLRVSGLNTSMHNARALAVNNNLTIVGQAITTDGSRYAIMWTDFAQGTLRYTVLSGYGTAYDINNQEAIVFGGALGGSVLLRQDAYGLRAGTYDLPSSVGYRSFSGLKIGESGIIAGVQFSQNTGGSDAITAWALNGGVRILGTPDQDFGLAKQVLGVDRNGRILGSSGYTATGTRVGGEATWLFDWLTGKVNVSLLANSPDQTGWKGLRGIALSRSGAIVAQEDASSPYQRGLLLTPISY